MKLETDSQVLFNWWIGQGDADLNVQEDWERIVDSAKEMNIVVVWYLDAYIER